MQSLSRLVVDRESGLPKGFGFCEFHEEIHARTAINSLDQQEITGRRIKVDSAEGNSNTENQTEDVFRLSAEVKKQIETALKKMPILEIYDMISEMKDLIKTDNAYAVQLFSEKPVLAQALISGQLMLGMLEISAAVNNQVRFFAIVVLVQFLMLLVSRK